MFDMSGLGQTPTITPDALSSDLADLSVAYQSVAADIPKSQRRQRDLRTLQVSTYLCFEENIEPR
jgi:hypothetical protein